MSEPFSPTHKAIIYDALSCTVLFTVALHCRVFELVPHGKLDPVLYYVALYCSVMIRLRFSNLPSKTSFSFQKSDLFCNVLFGHISMCTVIECGLLFGTSLVPTIAEVLFCSVIHYAVMSSFHILL